MNTYFRVKYKTELYIIISGIRNYSTKWSFFHHELLQIAKYDVTTYVRDCLQQEYSGIIWEFFTEITQVSKVTQSKSFLQ